MIRREVVDRLKKIDFNALDEGTRELQKKAYALGLTDWIDTSWEHPDPKVDAVFGDLHIKRLDDRHGRGAPYLDSCMMCDNPECDRTKDTGWTCTYFQRVVRP